MNRVTPEASDIWLSSERTAAPILYHGAARVFCVEEALTKQKCGISGHLAVSPSSRQSALLIAGCCQATILSLQ